MATTAEKKQWISERAAQKADAFAVRAAGRRATRAERTRIQHEVRDEFAEKYGLGWLTLLTWLPTIISLVRLILNQKLGKCPD